MKRIINLLLAGMFVAGTVSLVLMHATAKAIADEVTYTGINTGLADDDDTAAVNFGFDFTFNGVNYSSANVNINGTLNFVEENDEFDNTSLPNSNMGPAVLAFWDDIINTPKDVTCDDMGECDFGDNYPTIYYKTVGESGSRKFIVQWTNMAFYSNPEIPMGTFQVILYEGSNKVQIQYRELLGGDRSAGSSATVGLNFDADSAQQYFYNEDNLDNGHVTQGQAISYTPGVEGYTMNDTATYDPVYLVVEGVPNAPTLTSPANDSTGVYVNPTFRWQAEDLASSYRLIVSEDEEFSNIIISQPDITGTSFTPESPLDSEAPYYWRVEAINDSGSNMSDIWSFTTGSNEAPLYDEDGISEVIEDAAPNEGDANNDGTADSVEGSVASLVNPVTEKYTVLQTEGCETIQSISIHPVADNAVKDSGYDYPVGMANYTINCAQPGDTATVTLYYYGVDANGLVLRKYNETTKTYSTIDTANISEVTIAGQKVVRVVYQITDGSALDQDGEANGVIVDPAGLASLLVAVPNTGFQPKVLWPTMVVVFAGGGLLAATRRRHFVK